MNNKDKNLGLEDINHFELILCALEKAKQLQMGKKVSAKQSSVKTNIRALEEIYKNPSSVGELKSSLMKRCILGKQEAMEDEDEIDSNIIEEVQNSEFMVGIEEKITNKDAFLSIKEEEDI